jgi:hypothetical protein
VAVVTEPDAAPPPAPAAIVPDAAPVVVVPDAAPAAPPSPPPEPAEDIENVVADAVRKQIEAHRESVEQCYQRAAKSSTPEDPLAGRVEIHMTVQPAGDVTNVRVVRNDTGSDALGSCLVGVLSGFTIAGPPHEAIDYVWPFLFSGAEPK